MNRTRSRQMDQAESYYLLLELCCCEPIIQQAFSIIDNVCLSHGITAAIKGNHVQTDFQRHLNKYWIPFLGASIRAMHMYGFVPWRQKRLESGDYVPEVLPPGTFRWNVEVSDKNDSMLSYAVQLNAGAKAEPNIMVKEYLQPNFKVNDNSIMYATVASPMAYVIESYKHMQGAIKRQAHADAWNCTARITVSHEPKEFVNTQHQKEVFRTFDVPETGQYVQQQMRQPTETPQLDEIFLTQSMNHVPSVYSLPSWRHLEQTQALQPCMDIPFLQSKYKYDVCSLLGIPPDMLMTSQTKLEGNSNSHNRTQGVSRIFQAKMQRVCQFLKDLCEDVYETIYKGAKADFRLIPMPRLEIRDVEDLKVLFDIGILQPEHTVDLSTMLLGNLRKRKREEQPTLESKT